MSEYDTEVHYCHSDIFKQYFAVQTAEDRCVLVNTYAAGVASKFLNLDLPNVCDCVAGTGIIYNYFTTAKRLSGGHINHLPEAAPAHYLVLGLLNGRIFLAVG